jgi:RimJ/RimL family protein N-acetyltransferase
MTCAAGTVYEVTVSGHLDDHWSERLAGLRIVRQDDGTTLLSGPVADQAQLHGVIAGLRDIGVVLLGLRSAASGGGPTAAGAEPALDRVLRTQRLTLRPAVAADAAATWAFRRLPEVDEWLTGRPSTVQEYRELFTEPARLATTVVVELGPDHGGAVIGDLMLRREDGWAQLGMADVARGVQAELGWVLDPRHRGHGYATEAVRELIRYSFEELGLRRLVASSFLDNDASWRLMERLGMRRELHAVAEALHRSGRWLDTVGYALLAEEWAGR